MRGIKAPRRDIPHSFPRRTLAGAANIAHRACEYNITSGLPSLSYNNQTLPDPLIDSSLF